MTAFLEMYRAVTPLIQAGELQVVAQENDYRLALLALSSGTVRVKLLAYPDLIWIYVRSRADNTPWFELKSVIRAIKKVRPEWIVTPLPEVGRLGWMSAAEVSESLVGNWSALKRLGDQDFPQLEGLEAEDALLGA